jgi:pantoate--beta-alanine ligase
MRVLRTIAEVRAYTTQQRAAGRSIGLVPTMGAFHAGHLSLMRAARGETDTVVVSLFVNPAQFEESGDLAAYPRDEASDAELARAEGVDALFAPAADEIYPPGFATTVTVGAVAEPLEGAIRGPGHFAGVCTVVTKLLNIVGPDVAYFGQKDAQQVMVIRRMTLDLAISTDVIACPTVREADGLALSSRNVHLTPEQRAAAPVLHRALTRARERWEAGERSGEALRQTMRAELTGEPLADVDYVSVADGTTLAEADVVDGPAVLSLAVRFGTTRLIDNEPLGARPAST